jgi:Uma2 family endonuclease
LWRCREHVTVAAERIPYVTVDDYLAGEQLALDKSEYLSGEVFAVAGGSPEHSLIAANVGRELGNALKGKPCRVYNSDLRIRVAPPGLYTYPDVIVVCGPGRFGPSDTLENPTLIVEVLSPSTEAYDRGAKFAQYRRIASMREYVLVAQDRPSVERYVRRGDGGHEWVLSEATGRDAVLTLESVGPAVLSLAEVYYDVTFPDETNPT